MNSDRNILWLLGNLTLGTLAAFLKWFVVCAIFLLVRRAGLTIVGLENLPSNKAFILVSSHQLPITAEVAICSGALRRKILPWAAALQESATSSGTFWLYRHYSWGIIPISPGANLADLDALAERTRDELKRNNLVWVAPEGRFGYGLGVRRGFHSFIRVLRDLPEYKIVPMTVFGGDNCHWHMDIYRKHPNMTMVFGQPFQMSEHAQSSSVAEQSKATDEVMLRITSLMPASMHGYYTGAKLGEHKYTRDVSPSDE